MDIHRDVIVIGAGMAGLLTAYYLQERGKQVFVLEANEEAIGEYERLIKDLEIDCEFKRVPAYLYTLQNEKLLREEEKAAMSLGIDASFTTETKLPFPVAGAVCFQGQAQFSPLKFVKAIASKLEIMERTKVMDIKGNKIITNNEVMTSSMVAAMILSDEICGIKNSYGELFRPQRLNVKAGIRNFLIDAGESVKGLAKGLFHKNGPRCPHMGCELVWNPDEESWDCPCHGSRFEEDGKLLDNPAKKCIKHK